MDQQHRLEIRLRSFYDLFNSRDIDGCLARMTDDVDWHNAADDTREIGQEAVRGYWVRQFALISSRVTPMQVRFEPDGDAVVTVDQVVRTLDGSIRSHTTVLHRYRLRDGKVARMDASPAPAGLGRRI